jgi:hypothetical protein
MLTIILPLSVNLPRKKDKDKIFSLNLNIYRNAHHFTLNAAKIIYKEIVARAVQDTRNIGEPPYIFYYTFFTANNRACDVGNILPIVQKFTDDALIELGVITDDSYKIIRRNVHEWGGVDKNNPRVELTIRQYVAPF